MKKKVDVAIIGAGTAGLSAFKEASKYTNNLLIIGEEPLGTTCARTGCMPSKALIQAAHFFHDRHHFASQGIHGAEHLYVEYSEVLEQVRALRDEFTNGVVQYTHSLGTAFLQGSASFIAPDTLKVGEQTIQARAIIIATGSSSILPEAWQAFEDYILTSETFFEQLSLGPRVAVIGGGSIGLELGQALAYLGMEVSIYHAKDRIGGLSDPKVNEAAIALFKEVCSLHLNTTASLEVADKGVWVCDGDSKKQVDHVVAAMGRKPNIDALNLKALGVPLNESGLPDYDETSMKIPGVSVYIAGDVNQYRPLLHEAADEGRIAGFNAAHEQRCFQRRMPVSILFTDPDIAVVGASYQALKHRVGQDIIIGEVDYSNQGRAKIMRKNRGVLRLYGEKATGLLVGAELVAPGGEHLAHLLAWAIDKAFTAFDVLQMPFYHPVVEEGMRTALRALAKQVDSKSLPFDLALCDSEAIQPLS